LANIQEVADVVLPSSLIKSDFRESPPTHMLVWLWLPIALKLNMIIFPSYFTKRVSNQEFTYTINITVSVFQLTILRQVYVDIKMIAFLAVGWALAGFCK
jgi:hypothetical protein